MKHKHTPGPWHVEPGLYPNQLEVRASSTLFVATVHDTHAEPDQTTANAQLIAAAPELLEALTSAPAPEATDALAWLHAYSRWYHNQRERALRSAKEQS